MLRSVQVQINPGVTVATLAVGLVHNTSWNDYFIKTIDGLGPTDADVAFSTFASYDGALFQSTKARSRTLIFTIGYNPKYATGKDVEALRRALYPIFRPKSYISMFFNDTVEAPRIARGYVESIRPAIFVKDPEIIITVRCEDAYLEAYNSVTLNGTTGTPLDLSNYGDADTGFVLSVNAGSQTFATINVMNDVDPLIKVQRSFQANDIIKFSTVPGDKYVLLFRGGDVTRIMDSLVDSTLQMNINNLVDNFNVTATSASPLSYTLTFTPKWLGV